MPARKNPSNTNTRRLKKSPKSSRTPKAAPLTPAQQKFQDLLRECLPQERLFIKFKLERRSNTEAAILASYSEKTAEVQGAQLLSRLRVWNAYQAGLEAAGFGALDILDDIQALRSFDRSQIEREIKVPTTRVVSRRAEDVIQELITRERAVETFRENLERLDDQTNALLDRRLRALLAQRLELEEQVALDPEAMTQEEVTEFVTKRVLDYDLARQKNLLRFIKGPKPTAHGEIIELYDWLDGVEMAAKAQGLYKERLEMTGKDGESLGMATVVVLPSNGRGDV